MSSSSRFMFTYLALVSPRVALVLDVFARSLAEIGRADDDDLEQVSESDSPVVLSAAHLGGA